MIVSMHERTKPHPGPNLGLVLAADHAAGEGCLPPPRAVPRLEGLRHSGVAHQSQVCISLGKGSSTRVSGIEEVGSHGCQDWAAATHTAQAHYRRSGGGMQAWLLAPGYVRD